MGRWGQSRSGDWAPRSLRAGPLRTRWLGRLPDRASSPSAPSQTLGRAPTEGEGACSGPAPAPQRPAQFSPVSYSPMSLQVSPGLRGVGEMLSLLRIQPSVRAAPQGAAGAPSGAWVPLAVRLECGSEEGARALAGAVSPQHWPQLHSRLLVLPLNHLVVLPVLQVGGQLRVLSLLCPLPGSVALEEGGAVTRLRGGQVLFPGCGRGREAWPGWASSTQLAQVS